jgi:FlaA1/EpsC-like NDP-sugar epimerase
VNTSTANHIDDLLYDSGLFPFKKSDSKKLDTYDFSKEVIIVTGAAGSIGSELSRQLVQCKFKKLVLLDIAESPLYNLIKALEFEDTSKVSFKLLNIIEPIGLKSVFETYKPTLIFHTAAYKHVPLMEHNAYEAVKLNILGTKLIADLSIEFHVKKFIFISTDKAVNPIGVMGMSKRIGENYLNFLNQKQKTLFQITRFGNILGSNGSVVPVLKRQIESGSTLTITDTSTSRYFISKIKACHLILYIAKIDNTISNIFTFNMGKPIHISHIVERLVLLYKEIIETPEIKITHLRPGEKLHEELISSDEELLTTDHKDIFLVKSNNKQDSIKAIDFRNLLKVTPDMEDSKIKSILKSYL